MQPIKATVVIPTYDHGPLLSYSVASACQQTIKDIEIFIVGDCVPPITREIVTDLMKKDSRIRFFDNIEKDPNNGETHRNHALKEAQGEIVCYLSDDDLWLPNHVEVHYSLLKNAEFVNSIPIIWEPHGVFRIGCVDLSQPYFRQSILFKESRVPLSFASHTLEAYRQLPQGWRTTPKNYYSDHYMWLQFLKYSHFRACSSSEATAICFPSPSRKDWPLDKRLAELEAWQGKLQDSQSLDLVRQQILSACWRLMTWNESCFKGELERLAAIENSLKSELERLEAIESSFKGELEHLEVIENSLTWRLRNKLLAVPLLHKLIRTIIKLLAGRKYQILK